MSLLHRDYHCWTLWKLWNNDELGSREIEREGGFGVGIGFFFLNKARERGRGKVKAKGIGEWRKMEYGDHVTGLHE